MHTKEPKTSSLAFDLILHPARYVPQRKYLFIISHMRSRSTLLSHILGSHREIDGYSERHLHYNSKVDLLKLRYLTARDTELTGKYVFDKLLNNYCTISDTILKNPNTRYIYILRKPEETIKSIVNMGNNLVHNIKWYQDVTKVTQYYIDRLERMVTEATLTKGRAYLILSERLIDDTTNTLQEISTWLTLASPLTASYHIFQNTGKAGYGDPSANIMKGEIDSEHHDYPVDIPPELASKARAAYQKCKIALSEKCQPLLVENAS